MNSNMTEDKYKELREDFRMVVNVPFSFSLFNEDEDAKKVSSQIDNCLGSIEKEVEGGKLMAEAFGLLNDKLNVILKTLEETGKNITFPDKRDVSLSVGGVGFRNNTALLPGDTLRLVLALPPMPYALINTLGAVIRSEEKSDEKGTYFEIAVKFQQIGDDERQDITRFLFNVQRRSGH